MTQARDILPLNLQLTPMQVPEVAPQAIGRIEEGSPLVSMGTVGTERIGCYLTLYPGEPAEILVQLENQGNSTLQLNTEIKGDFPSEWYRFSMEGHEVLPRRQIEAVVYFQLPADFFESDESWSFGQSQQLDYQGKIYVNYADPETGRQLMEVRTFNLYIRPRSLYPTFLPDIYREVDFIGRLLKIFEQAFEPTVQTLDALWAYLDPLMAPEALLPFLAHWVGWPLNPALSLNRQRYLIRQAMQIYRWRGTRRGLRFYLHLFTDLPLDEHLPEQEKHISIQEVFSRGLVMGETRLNRDSFIGGGQPYHFIVVLHRDNTTQIDEQLVHQIIQQEKPAFCTYELYIE
ncbi:MAG TPA: phage tail protein [Cyanobacteria bacterium UBA8803]|nr:phage tail protein [Cyanobacteria bacterium UBA9273]HBL59288.1 phage tail protein [Cyanobacteria bacterium UBA8803]